MEIYQNIIMTIFNDRNFKSIFLVYSFEFLAEKSNDMQQLTGTGVYAKEANFFKKFYFYFKAPIIKFIYSQVKVLYHE